MDSKRSNEKFCKCGNKFKIETLSLKNNKKTQKILSCTNKNCFYELHIYYENNNILKTTLKKNKK